MNVTAHERGPTELHHEPSFFESLRLQLRVIGALLMREVITRYGRHNLGFVWMFAEPMLFTIGVTVLWSVFHHLHAGSNIPIPAFALTGYSALVLFRNCASRCVLAILPNQGLLYHRNVRVADLFFARLVLEIGGATASVMVLTAIYAGLGLMSPPEDLGLALAGWLLLIFFCAGWGLLVGGLSEMSEVFERLWHPISYFMLPISGVFYLVDWLPPQLQKILLFWPMVSGVELFRQAYYGSLIHAHYEIPYAVEASLVVWLVALWVVRTAATKVEPE